MDSFLGFVFQVFLQQIHLEMLFYFSELVKTRQIWPMKQGKLENTGCVHDSLSLITVICHTILQKRVQLNCKTSTL